MKKKNFFSLAFAGAMALLFAPQISLANNCSVDFQNTFPTTESWEKAYIVKDEDGMAWQRAILSNPKGIAMLEEDKSFFIEGTAEAGSEVQVYIYHAQKDGNGNTMAPSLGTCFWSGTANENGFFSAEIHSRLLWNNAGESPVMEAFFQKQGAGSWQIQSQNSNQNFYIGTHIPATKAQIGAQGNLTKDCQMLCSSEEADKNLIKLQEAHVIKPSEFTNVTGDNFLSLGDEDIALSKIDHTFYAGKKSGIWNAPDLSETALKSLLTETIKQEMTKNYPGYDTMTEITEKNIGDAYNKVKYAPEVQEIIIALGNVFTGTNAAKQDSAAQYLADIFRQASGCEAPKCIAPTKEIIIEVFAPVANPMIPNAACSNTETSETECVSGVYTTLQVHCMNRTDTHNISVSQSGEYKITGFVERGGWGNCETEETFSINVNGQNSSVSADDADVGAITKKNEMFGIFTLNSGNNLLTMNAESPACTIATNSVDIKKICVEPAVDAPTCDLSISPGVVNPGETATLSWSTTDASSASINNGVGSVSPTTGGIQINPTQDMSYIMTVDGPGGQDTCTTTLAVNDVSVFQVEKFVSLDGVNYGQQVEAEAGDTVYYKIITTNTGNADGNTGISEVLSDPTNGGGLGDIENYELDVPPHVVIQGMFFQDGGLSIVDLAPGEKAELTYSRKVNDQGIPANTTSSIVSTAFLSSGGSNTAEVIIPSSLLSTDWSKEMVDIFLLWTGSVETNACLLEPESNREMEKNFHDNFDTGSHVQTNICGWDVIYTNGFSSPAILIHSEEEVLLQPNFDDVKIAKVNKRFTSGENGWRLEEGKKEPIFYRYQTQKDLDIETNSTSCVQKKDLGKYAEFLQIELNLLDTEIELIVEEINAQLEESNNDFYEFSIGNPEQVSNIFDWKVNGKNAEITPLFFEIEKNTCKKNNFVSPEKNVKDAFAKERIGFEVGEIQ